MYNAVRVSLSISVLKVCNSVQVNIHVKTFKAEKTNCQSTKEPTHGYCSIRESARSGLDVVFSKKLGNLYQWAVTMTFERSKEIHSNSR